MAASRASNRRPGAPKNTYTATMKVSDAELSKFIHAWASIFRKRNLRQRCKPHRRSRSRLASGQKRCIGSRRGIRRLLSEPDEDARDEYTRPANSNALPKETHALRATG